MYLLFGIYHLSPIFIYLFIIILIFIFFNTTLPSIKWLDRYYHPLCQTSLIAFFIFYFVLLDNFLYNYHKKNTYEEFVYQIGIANYYQHLSFHLS